MHKIVYQDNNTLTSYRILEGLYKKYNVIYYSNIRHTYDKMDLLILDVSDIFLCNSNKYKMIIEGISKRNIPMLFMTDPLFQCKRIIRYTWFIDLCFSTFKPLFYTKEFDNDVERAVNSKRIKFNAT